MQCEVCGATASIGVTLIPQKNLFGVSVIYRCVKHHVPEQIVKPKIYSEAPVPSANGNPMNINDVKVTSVTALPVSGAAQRIKDAIRIVAELAESTERTRPYPTTEPEGRDHVLVFGLTFRDISDCMIMGILACQEKMPREEFIKSWNVPVASNNHSNEPSTPTAYLLTQLAKFDHPAYFLPAKVQLGLWTYADLYKIGQYDPIEALAAGKVFIEQMMNIPRKLDLLPVSEVLEPLKPVEPLAELVATQITDTGLTLEPIPIQEAEPIT
jgi:hypothetical protein